MMKEEEERWERRGKRIIYGEPELELLVDTGYNARLGARHLSRNLERLVSQPMSEAACQDSWPDVQQVTMRANGITVDMEFATTAVPPPSTPPGPPAAQAQDPSDPKAFKAEA